MNTYEAERRVIDQLRAHEINSFGTALGNVAGNCADIISYLLVDLEKKDQLIKELIHD